MPRACRLLLEVCREPSTWDTLKGAKGLKIDTFEVVIELNKAGAISFDKVTKKYYATQDALDALNEFSKDGQE